MRQLSLILGAVLLAVLLVREPVVPVPGSLDGEGVPALSCADPTPDLVRSNGAPRLQGTAMGAAVRDQADREPGEGASVSETARARDDFYDQWKEIMADLESTYHYPVIETVVFPENWLDELERESRDSPTMPTISGAPGR